MASVEILVQRLHEKFSDIQIKAEINANHELTIEIPSEHILFFCKQLHELPEFQFEQLVDICGVDYSQYGVADWITQDATTSGFSRGVEKDLMVSTWSKPRFAVVYHLLSVSLNHRIRIRVFASNELPEVHSISSIWENANWFEREAFDLYGILFSGHPDLRRILTDYGFMGHPFRKDFPLIGNVEMRYDAGQQRVVYEPVSITPRTLVAKVIRQDNRYEKSS